MSGTEFHFISKCLSIKLNNYFSLLMFYFRKIHVYMCSSHNKGKKFPNHPEFTTISLCVHPTTYLLMLVYLM